jgi:hypothetical protein
MTGKLVNTRLKLWSDKKFLRSLQDIRPILMPFWGLVKKDEPHKNRFDVWANNGKSIFSFVNSMEEADIVVYPQDPTLDSRGFQKFQDITGNKMLFAFFNSDSEEHITMRSNSILFRTSILRSKKETCEFGLPAWSEDWGFLGHRSLNTNPVIGFCGQDHRPRVRASALNILEKSGITTNFIRKKQFWGGWITGGRKLEHGKALRQEFVNNLRDCDYGFCARGGGNFSFRLYETMMSGRIPVLINTDCLLPYDFLIRWGDFFPIIDESNLETLPSVLISFHQRFKTTREFNKHQLLIRKMWKKYLSPTGFFSNIHKHWADKESFYG